MNKLEKALSIAGFTANVGDLLSTIVGLGFFPEKVHEGASTMAALLAIHPLLFMAVKFIAGVWIFMPFKYSLWWICMKIDENKRHKTCAMFWLKIGWVMAIIYFAYMTIKNLYLIVI